MSNNYQVLLFYKFIEILDPNALMASQKILCEQLGLKGRILLSKEGINATLEGTFENTEKYISILIQRLGFEDIKFKKSNSNGLSFPKLMIKVRDEIVTTGLPYNQELGPLTGMTGNYITVEELHDLYDSDQEFYIIDMRNDYEHKVGYFRDSILLNKLDNFRNLPETLEQIKHLKDKKIITVCTGGIRCEKASGFLMYHGFNDVWQLKDGIVSYMEKYPNEDFLGKLYVFDKRLMMGFRTQSKDHNIIGRCEYCQVVCENMIDYKNEEGKRIHGIVCANCLQKEDIVLD